MNKRKRKVLVSDVMDILDERIALWTSHGTEGELAEPYGHLTLVGELRCIADMVSRAEDKGFNAALADCEPIVAKMKAEIAELRSQLNQKPSRERVREAILDYLRKLSIDMYEKQLIEVDEARLWNAKCIEITNEAMANDIADAILKLLQKEG